MKKFAVIDVGSNSVRLMFVADGTVLYKRLRTTRLGEGIAQEPRLKPEAIRRTAQAIADFNDQAKEEGAEGVFVFATAAVRSAENRADFLSYVQKLCGVEVEVISGEEEAEIGLLGALGFSDGAVIDIGGASTEIVARRQGEIIYKKSVNVGVVRLKDKCGRDPKSLQAVAAETAKAFGSVPNTLALYGIGGTATTLAAQSLRLTEYDSGKVTGTVITDKEMQTLADRLSVLSVEEIAALPCMPVGRADVITGGAILLSTLMRRLGFKKITVSDRDNLEGYAIKKGWLR